MQIDPEKLAQLKKRPCSPGYDMHTLNGYGQVIKFVILVVPHIGSRDVTRYNVTDLIPFIFKVLLYAGSSVGFLSPGKDIMAKAMDVLGAGNTSPTSDRLRGICDPKFLEVFQVYTSRAFWTTLHAKMDRLAETRLTKVLVLLNSPDGKTNPGLPFLTVDQELAVTTFVENVFVGKELSEGDSLADLCRDRVRERLLLEDQADTGNMLFIFEFILLVIFYFCIVHVTSPSVTPLTYLSLSLFHHS